MLLKGTKKIPKKILHLHKIGKLGYTYEFNGAESTVQNNFAHTTNQNIKNCHISYFFKFT